MALLPEAFTPGGVPVLLPVARLPSWPRPWRSVPSTPGPAMSEGPQKGVSSALAAAAAFLGAAAVARRRMAPTRAATSLRVPVAMAARRRRDDVDPLDHLTPRRPDMAPGERLFEQVYRPNMRTADMPPEDEEEDLGQAPRKKKRKAAWLEANQELKKDPAYGKKWVLERLSISQMTEHGKRKAAKVVPLSEAIQLRISAIPPAPTTLVTKSTTEGADSENSINEVVAEDVPCSRTASCKCAECKAAMAAVMHVESGTPAAAPSSPADPQRDMRQKFLQMSAAERSEVLCGHDQTLAKAVGTWLQDMSGATSATRTQMQPQEALVAALDETAIWQHHAARRSANLAEEEEKVILPFRSDTVLAALLRGGGFEAVVALCGGPADCTRWRALALLLHCRCCDGNQLAQRTAVPFLEPDEYASSPRIHHLSDKVYTQFYDVDAWLTPMVDAGLTPQSQLVGLSHLELEALDQACQVVSKRAATLPAEPHVDTADAVWDYLTTHCTAADVLVQLAKRLEVASRTLHQSAAASSSSSESFFVKLSTRSPKDSSLFAARAAAAVGLDAQCEGAPMRVESGAEAIALLTTSERVRADVRETLLLAAPNTLTSNSGDCELHTHISMSVVVREWWYVPRWTEMRGFVRRASATHGNRRHLTALSVYNIDDPPLDRSSSSDNHALAKNAMQVRDALTKFVEARLDSVLEAADLDHAVVDFALRPCDAEAVADLQLPSNLQGGDSGGSAADSAIARFQIVVLELNSFGFRSSGVLFDWRDDEDATLLFEGDPKGKRRGRHRKKRWSQGEVVDEVQDIDKNASRLRTMYKRPRFNWKEVSKDDLRTASLRGDQPAIGNGQVWLSKFLSHSGVCSRRRVTELVLQGRITVNNEVVKAIRECMHHELYQDTKYKHLNIRHCY
ncbi:hypothetical protein AK812_SmicGene97 [Symbiodinium microadriaticum]|uniref:RNA-binding S4 domain-containing protein n=1 Tax=Symbiodinium microadriaticum TaxID=2951 RepID=A0A1Q9F7M3_SYMMI|nr:hypothetical protein AK812_SmicGene97 [Symbiodinium microadriaticum]